MAASLPNPASNAKATIDYAHSKLSLKASAGLNATPVVDLAVGTAIESILLGAELAYDSGKAELTKYNISAGARAAPIFHPCCAFCTAREPPATPLRPPTARAASPPPRLPRR